MVFAHLPPNDHSKEKSRSWWNDRMQLKRMPCARKSPKTLFWCVDEIFSVLGIWLENHVFFVSKPSPGRKNGVAPMPRPVQENPSKHNLDFLMKNFPSWELGWKIGFYFLWPNQAPEGKMWLPPRPVQENSPKYYLDFLMNNFPFWKFG